MLWDVFISHASEDKNEVVRPLSRLLEEEGLRVWLDESELRLGDSLSQKIDEGLAQSRFGLIVLSEAFFAKSWPRRELSGLVARESTGEKAILPIWHRVDQQYIARYSPIIADRLGISTERGLQQVVREILKVTGGSRKATAQQIAGRYSNSFEFPIELITNAEAAIRKLSQMDSWRKLKPKRDTSRSDVWIGTDSDCCIQVLYSLYAPLALFHQRQYALTRSAATFHFEAIVRLEILKSALYALTHENQLASSDPALAYTPRVPEWRRKRASEPERYWWQGISDDRFLEARDFLLAQQNEGYPVEVCDFSTFAATYHEAYNSCGRPQQTIGLLANHLFGFSPKTRPVYWRLLLFWSRIYNLYQKAVSEPFQKIEEVNEEFRLQQPLKFSASEVKTKYLPEPLQDTIRATTNFWESFIYPTLHMEASQVFRKSNSL